jgi:hypothetical protein
MGYSNLLKNMTRKAFNLIGDLATEVILTKRTNVGFDFATNTTSTGTLASSRIKGIFNSKRNTGKPDSPTISESFMFKAEDLDEPDIYDKITTADGNVWKIIPPFDNDGSIITIYVARES